MVVQGIQGLSGSQRIRIPFGLFGVFALVPLLDQKGLIQSPAVARPVAEQTMDSYELPVGVQALYPPMNINPSICGLALLLS